MKTKLKEKINIVRLNYKNKQFFLLEVILEILFLWAEFMSLEEQMVWKNLMTFIHQLMDQIG